jgi:hypothetical protein
MISAIIGEFDQSHLIVEATKHLRGLGYSRLDTFTPHAIPSLDEAFGIRRTMLRWWVLAMGLTGVAVAYLIEWGTNAILYPSLIGGRPYNSVATDIPIMFETGVLFAGVTAFVSCLVASRMPRLYSPILEVPGFDRTSVDRFWLFVEHPDPAWTADLPKKLEDLGALRVLRVGSVPS